MAIFGPMRSILAVLCRTLIALLVPVLAEAQPPAGYYASAEGLTGQPLRAALHNIIDGHTALSYSAIWNAFYATDAKPGNKVWDMYSDIPGGTPPYVYTLGTHQCGGYTAEGDCYNREHSFPQSWFNSGNPMRTDLFHIYATDGWVNNKRGNLAFGKVGSADWTSENGSKVGLSVTPGYNATVFEPIDEYKGDFARSYFYMMTRYYGSMGSWNSPMMTGGDLSPWAVALLVAWSDLDPVSPKETARNNAVYALQHNRNPFIDRPEWVHSIWAPNTGVAEQVGEQLALQCTPGALIIGNNTPGQAMLTVMDSTGRQMLRLNLQAGEQRVAFSGAPGIYIAELRTPTGRLLRAFHW